MRFPGPAAIAPVIIVLRGAVVGGEMHGTIKRMAKLSIWAMDGLPRGGSQQGSCTCAVRPVELMAVGLELAA